MRWLSLLAVLCLLSSCLAQSRPATEVLLEDFGATWKDGAWSFSNGPEFPGAAGKFERVKDDPLKDRFVGKLSFDFSGGGNYVAAMRGVKDAPDLAAVRVRVLKPQGVRLVFRVSDSSGQTLQKELPSPVGRWADAQVNMGDFEGHWGGANDGAVHGRAKQIQILAEHRGPQSPLRGEVLLGDIRLVSGQAGEFQDWSESEYVAIDFASEGPWRLEAAGEPGAAKLQGASLTYDFSKGLTSAGVQVDRTLTGEPRQLRLRFRAQTGSHLIKITMRSHFEMFDYWLEPPKSDGENDVVLPLPPGPNWHCYGGEDDGKLHGPLRLGAVTVEAKGKPDGGMLELLDLRVKGRYPSHKACLLTAELRQGETPTFVAKAANLSDHAIDATVYWTFRDWAGLTLTQGSQAVSLPPGGRPVEVTPPALADAQQRPLVEAQFEMAAPGQVVTAAFAYRVDGVEARPGSDRLEPDSPLGMGLYLYRYQWDELGMQGLERAAKLARAAGVKWTREQFDWAGIEKTQGRFDWKFHDDLVATARRNGIGVYGILCYWTPWTKPYTAEGIEDFCRYAEACADHCKDSVACWEIWNEPDIFFWQGPKDLYAQLLAKAYAAVKKGNPNAKVLGCCTSEVDTAFIQRTMELGGPFDVLTVHPYREALDDAKYIADLEAAAKLVNSPQRSLTPPGDRPDRAATRPAAAGMATRPVWITEVGWPTYRSTNANPMDEYYTITPRWQACLLARSYLCALAAGVGNIAWYDFRDDGSDPYYNENNYGIVSHDLRPKPAYRAMATVARLLEGKRFAARVELGKGLMALRFDGPGNKKQTLAVWATEQDLSVDVPAGTSTEVTDLMGQSQPLRPANGLVHLDLKTGVPVLMSSGN